MASRKRSIEQKLEQAKRSRITSCLEDKFFTPRKVEEPGKETKVKSKCKNCRKDVVVSNGSKSNYTQHQCTGRPRRTERQWHNMEKLLREKNQQLRERDETIRLLRIENEALQEAQRTSRTIPNEPSSPTIPATSNADQESSTTINEASTSTSVPSSLPSRTKALHLKTGYCLILDFDVESETQTRNLRETFKKLGGNVNVLNKASRPKVIKLLKKLQQIDWTRYDHLVIAITSHGHGESFRTSDSFSIEFEFVRQAFDGIHCPGLRGKPKIFFVNTCRGEQPNVNLHVPTKAPSRSNEEVVPSDSEFFVAWATTPGNLAYGRRQVGAIFMQHVCDVFQRHHMEQDLCRMMTRVNHILPKDNYFDQVPFSTVQMPVYSSSLTRTIMFDAPAE